MISTERAQVASLLIRDMDDATKERLRVRAALNGRSMEAEARAILDDAVAGRRPHTRLGSHIGDQFAALGGVDVEVPPRSDAARAADFSR